MQQRRFRPGDVLDDYCPRERRITDHAIVAMIDDHIKQTRCCRLRRGARVQGGQGAGAAAKEAADGAVHPGARRPPGPTAAARLRAPRDTEPDPGRATTKAGSRVIARGRPSLRRLPFQNAATDIHRPLPTSRLFAGVRSRALREPSANGRRRAPDRGRRRSSPAAVDPRGAAAARRATPPATRAHAGVHDSSADQRARRAARPGGVGEADTSKGRAHQGPMRFGRGGHRAGPAGTDSRQHGGRSPWLGRSVGGAAARSDRPRLHVASRRQGRPRRRRRQQALAFLGDCAGRVSAQARRSSSPIKDASKSTSTSWRTR